MTADTYKTLAAPSGEAVYKEKGSKFIAMAFPVSTPAEAEDIVSTLRRRFHDARHICFAYRAGDPLRPAERANDDGEPARSAGIPILNRIKGHNLTGTLVVVVRYFGGVKLGVGGLKRAYAAAAGQALSQAPVKEVPLYRYARLRLPYAALHELMRYIKKQGLTVAGQKGDTAAELTVGVPPSRWKEFRTKFQRYLIDPPS